MCSGCPEMNSYARSSGFPASKLVYKQNENYLTVILIFKFRQSQSLKKEIEDV